MLSKIPFNILNNKILKINLKKNLNSKYKCNLQLGDVNIQLHVRYKISRSMDLQYQITMGFMCPIFTFTIILFCVCTLKPNPIQCSNLQDCLIHNCTTSTCRVHHGYVLSDSIASLKVYLYLYMVLVIQSVLNSLCMTVGEIINTFIQ